MTLPLVEPSPDASVDRLLQPHRGHRTGLLERLERAHPLYPGHEEGQPSVIRSTFASRRQTLSAAVNVPRKPQSTLMEDHHHGHP